MKTVISKTLVKVMDAAFVGGSKSWTKEVIGTDQVSKFISITETSIKQYLKNCEFFF